MKSKILKLLNSKDYSKMNIAQLQEYFSVESSDDFKNLVKALNELEDQGELCLTNKLEYDLPERLGYKKGNIQIKEKGFGFILMGDSKKDLFVPRENINNAMNGDYVLVKEITSKSSNKGNLERYSVIKILKRENKFIVGTVKVNNKSFILIPDEKKLTQEFFIKEENLLGAVSEHKVKCEVINFLSSNKIEVKVVKVIGHVNDPGIDILSICEKNDIITEFLDETLAHANMIPNNIELTDLKDRKDLRNEIIVTIDGADAKDLDDAVTVKLLEDGNYFLGVYIADVSHYVKEGSPIDLEAFSRGTSVYLADRVVPMIPHRLSNGICSLNPHVDRLVIGCEMIITPSGKVDSYEIIQGVINTTERMTYNSVNKILIDKDNDECTRYSKLVNMFGNMEKLAEILRTRRYDRGSINFETKESKIIVDERGFPIDIVLRERYVAEKLIEEFMLCANETVAEHIFWMELPFIYRVHEEPNKTKVEKFIALVKSMGYNIQGVENTIHPTQLQKILEEVEGKPEESSVNTMLLRSMMKAKYTDQPLGHYGLSTKYYTHFTSPIRRYPDTIVHRLLREYIVEGNTTSENIDKWAIKLVEIGLHTSKKERDAIECEREVDDMKKAEFMETKIGEEFIGKISGLTSWGIFVELENTIEGLVNMMDLRDDYYEFIEEKMIILGRKYKKIFKIGDELKVLCSNASKEDRRVDFEIVSLFDNNEEIDYKEYCKHKSKNNKPKSKIAQDKKGKKRKKK